MPFLDKNDDNNVDNHNDNELDDDNNDNNNNRLQSRHFTPLNMRNKTFLDFFPRLRRDVIYGVTLVIKADKLWKNITNLDLIFMSHD